jgi:hypothetical protein
VSLERNLASSTARAQSSRCFYSSCRWTAGAIIKSPHASLKTANSTVSTMSPSSCAPSMQNHIAGCTSFCHHGDSGSSRAASEEPGKFGHLPPKPTPYSPYFYPTTQSKTTISHHQARISGPRADKQCTHLWSWYTFLKFMKTGA